MSAKECQICFIPFDEKQHFPKIIKCGHTYCDLCVKSLTNCPLCRQPFNQYSTIKNYAMLPEKEVVVPVVKNEPKKSEKAIEMKLIEKEPEKEQKSKGNSIKCRNGHEAVWENRKSQCYNCKTHASGWGCKPCKFHYCDNCAKTIFTYKSCPNGHKPVWNGRWAEKLQCDKCKKTTLTSYCLPCRTMHCRACTVNPKTYRVCTKHNITCNVVQEIRGISSYECPQCAKTKAIPIFREVQACFDGRPQKQCNKDDCYNPSHWTCFSCSMRLCNMCAKTEYVAKKCPNNHDVTWSGDKYRCANCHTVDTGFRCLACNYNLCDKCEKKCPIKVFRENKQSQPCCSVM